MGKGDLFWGGGNGAYLVGKGDLFDRGGGPIWWGRGAYLVGKGFFFSVGNGGPIRLGRGTT